MGGQHLTLRVVEVVDWVKDTKKSAERAEAIQGAELPSGKLRSLRKRGERGDYEDG